MSKQSRVSLIEDLYQLHVKENTTSLSLNKYIHVVVNNSTLHSSKSLLEPSDHFVVYLYRKSGEVKPHRHPLHADPFHVPRLSSEDISYIQQQWCGGNTFYWFAVRLGSTWSYQEVRYTTTQASDGEPSTNRPANDDVHRGKHRGWPHISCSQLKRSHITQICRALSSSLGSFSQTIGSRVKDIVVWSWFNWVSKSDNQYKKLNHSSTPRRHISIIVFHTEKCSIRQQKPLGLHLVNFLDNPEDL